MLHSAPSSRSRWAPPSLTPDDHLRVHAAPRCSSSRQPGVSFAQWNTASRSSARAMSNITSAGCRPRSAAIAPIDAADVALVAPACPTPRPASTPRTAAGAWSPGRVGFGLSIASRYACAPVGVGDRPPPLVERRVHQLVPQRHALVARRPCASVNGPFSGRVISSEYTGAPTAAERSRNVARLRATPWSARRPSSGHPGPG